MDNDMMVNVDEQSDNSGELVQPMNLSNQEQPIAQQKQNSLENQGTNLTTCDTNVTSTKEYNSVDVAKEKSDIKIKLKNKIITGNSATSSEYAENARQQTQQPQQQPENLNVQNILCKKVRQAQQAKAMNAINSIQYPEPVNANVSVITSTSAASGSATLQQNDPEYPTQMLMPAKIPIKRKLRKEASNLIRKCRLMQKLNGVGNPSPSLNQVESSDLVFQKDDLKNEILPRERFDSICNMDKNALDSYLNLNEDNSQDPELLQYFGGDKTEIVPQNDVGEEDDVEPSNSGMPLMDNYNLFSDEKVDNSSKISQLRSMLEQNIPPHLQSCALSGPNIQSVNNNNPNDNAIKSLLLSKSPINSGNCSSEPLNLYPAAASLAIMSQRHHTNSVNGNGNTDNISQNVQQSQMKAYPNIVAPSSSNVPQSPNTKRKNFSFVPIPQKSSCKKINYSGSGAPSAPMSPFVSPRSTPNLKRSKNLAVLNIQDPKMMTNACNAGFSSQQHFKTEPVSAPPSPSMISNCRYGPPGGQNFHFTPLSISNPNISCPVEARSQSVPPHCTNNNQYSFSTDYSSACNSVAPTPAPSEYADFTDTSILEIFNNDQAPTIKIENNDLMHDFMEEGVMPHGHSENEMLEMTQNSARQNYSNVSRSVPTTPLPYANYIHFNNHIGNKSANNNSSVGKSMPTTPIGQFNSFRYSPDSQRSRDFLINGYGNNNGNINNNNNVNIENKNIKQSPIQGPLNNNLPITSTCSSIEPSNFPEIDDIPAFDPTILNNL